MTYELICERLIIVKLDDCSILQCEHLVRSNMSRAHDSFNVQNLSISHLCMLKSQVMCHMTNEHLARLYL
jgi:hypothetical protein